MSQKNVSINSAVETSCHTIWSFSVLCSLTCENERYLVFEINKIMYLSSIGCAPNGTVWCYRSQGFNSSWLNPQTISIQFRRAQTVPRFYCPLFSHHWFVNHGVFPQDLSSKTQFQWADSLSLISQEIVLLLLNQNPCMLHIPLTSSVLNLSS